ncbi:MAG: sulfatase-like hydrolase/transferase, partial [Aurantibacter sp.]
INFMKDKKSGNKPFLMLLSWGTPHAPYHTAPKDYRELYDADKMILRENVPDSLKQQVKKDLAGYYAHMTALDDMIGKLIRNLKESGQLEHTIVVFTSDHGDLLGSHGAYKKQQPYEESIRVPMLFYVPERLGISSGPREALINSEDILPTLLGLCNISIPGTVEGINYWDYLLGKEEIGNETLIGCVQPFGQWNKVKHGAREYRGIKTLNYTYARDLDGPWLLFDNNKDPYQLNNLVGQPEFTTLQLDLDKRLTDRLKATGDEFLPGEVYLQQWGYTVDETGTVPYVN